MRLKSLFALPFAFSLVLAAAGAHASSGMHYILNTPFGKSEFDVASPVIGKQTFDVRARILRGEFGQYNQVVPDNAPVAVSSTSGNDSFLLSAWIKSETDHSVRKLNICLETDVNKALNASTCSVVLLAPDGKAHAKLFDTKGNVIADVDVAPTSSDN
ncbi:hypothetical protein [Gluconobacter cerinus]|uniref:hypothetical protein n=1 Tax=Gluconobacter cerinus TaxID=38307 RepID=UPI001B8AB459|nr:hypothetical protein [Gluconobacter cerinus]MBS0983387.1 hypothetical protein [Gluconobacter cerinus]